MRHSVECARHADFKAAMQAIGFFGKTVPAKYIQFWDNKLSSGEREVILKSAGLSTVYKDKPLEEYAAEVQQKIVKQINRACDWGDMLKRALF